MPCIKGVFNDPARGRIFVLIRLGALDYPSLSPLLTPDKLMAASEGFELYGPLYALDVRTIEANAILNRSRSILSKGDVLLTELPSLRHAPGMRDLVAICAASDMPCIRNAFNEADGRIFVLIRPGMFEYPSLSQLLTADRRVAASDGFELYGPLQAADMQTVEVNAILKQSLQPVRNRGDVLLTQLPSIQWAPEMRDSVASCAPADMPCIKDVFNDPARGYIFVLIRPGVLEYPSLVSLLTPEKRMAESGGFELYGPLRAADIASLR
jgi:hypothetical protein